MSDKQSDLLTTLAPLAIVNWKMRLVFMVLYALVGFAAGYRAELGLQHSVIIGMLTFGVFIAALHIKDLVFRKIYRVKENGNYHIIEIIKK